MVWRLSLESGLTVENEAGSLGPPPNSTVAVLLILLAARNGAVVSRAELAARLYPGSPRPEALNALRQSLFRLRGWLGHDGVQAEGAGVRLTPTAWTLVPDVLGGERMDSILLAGVDHPALDPLRREWSRPTGVSLDDTARAFVAVVKGLVDVDVDAARGVFVAGGPLLGRLGNENVAELLRQTKPKTRLEPYALEHRERAAFFYCHVAEFERALTHFVDVFRIARRSGKAEVSLRAASHVVCLLIEMGEMREAEGWLDRVSGDAKPGSKLDLLNSQACLYWNAGDHERALASMAEAKGYLAAADHAGRVRFWVNYSLLSAEAGRVELSREAVAQATDLSPQDGSAPNPALEVAQALQWAKGGEPHRAIDLLSRSLRKTRDGGNRVGAMYVEETLAELLAGVGNAREAKNLWHSARGKRLGKHNPRTLARHRRIESLCA